MIYIKKKKSYSLLFKEITIYSSMSDSDYWIIPYWWISHLPGLQSNAVYNFPKNFIAELR